MSTEQLENALIIAGAGASKALDSNIPTMQDFFKSCAQFALDDGNETISLALAYCDYERCFENPHAECENKAVHYLDHSDDKDAEKKRDYKNDYLKTCTERFSQTPENLESVMQKAVQRNGFSKGGLIYGVNSLLDKFISSGEIQKTANKTYENLFDKIDLFAGHSAIVSFNYDTFIENALWNYLQKMSDHGFKSTPTARKIYDPAESIIHCYQTRSNAKPLYDEITDGEAVWFDTPPDAIQFPTSKFEYWPPIQVLKPHGSLNWFVRSGQENHGPLTVLLNDDGKQFSSCPTFYFNGFDSNKPLPFPQFAPLLVPPTKNKIRSHPILWSHDKIFSERLADAMHVIIIGWSMPETVNISDHGGRPFRSMRATDFGACGPPL